MDCFLAVSSFGETTAKRSGQTLILAGSSESATFGIDNWIKRIGGNGPPKQPAAPRSEKSSLSIKFTMPS